MATDKSKIPPIPTIEKYIFYLVKVNGTKRILALEERADAWFHTLYHTVPKGFSGPDYVVESAQVTFDPTFLRRLSIIRPLTDEEISTIRKDNDKRDKAIQDLQDQLDELRSRQRVIAQDEIAKLPDAIETEEEESEE